MTLAMERFRGNGIYLLDEPEAALSPTRQLALLSRIHQLVRASSQFVIATHSPILMAYPNATIYHIATDSIHAIDYTATEHYAVTKRFLNDHEAMLNEVLRE
jgi:predicted ATPase